jgi:hypothetical protein
MTMTIEELLQSGIDQARRVLIGVKDAELMPTFVVQFKDRPAAIIGAPWANDRDKYATTEAVRLAMKTHRDSVISYLFWSEAWRAHESIDHPIGLAPRDREDREEVVMINAFDKQGGKMVSLLIERGPDGVVTDLVKDKNEDSYANFEGRLYNLLRDD